jgi:ABC-2 type transport system permease protein
MKNLIRAELLKLRTTRMFWGTVAAALAFVPISIAQAIYSAGQTGGASLDSSEGVRHVMSAASSGALMITVIGILLMAGEFRHNTATATFLISPDRIRVVFAKLAAATLAGLAVAVAASVLTLAVALPWLSANDVAVASHGSDIALALIGAIAATTLAGLVGVGIGALVPNQTVAVTVWLTWVFTVEAILISFAPAIGRWLPGGAASALTGVATANGGLLPMWGGALLVTLYGLAFAAAGTRLILRRDIA